MCAFRDLSGLPPDERREQLMNRLEHVWEEAQAKCYTTKKGDSIPSPDTAVMLKVVQAVAVLQGLTGQQEAEEGKKLAAMSDADLVREATKRLPPSQVAELARALMQQYADQQQASGTLPAVITTTGETTDGERTEQAGGGDEAEADEHRAPGGDSEWA